MQFKFEIEYTFKKNEQYNNANGYYDYSTVKQRTVFYTIASESIDFAHGSVEGFARNDGFRYIKREATNTSIADKKPLDYDDISVVIFLREVIE